MAGIMDAVIGAVAAMVMIVVFLEILRIFTWNTAATNISRGAISLLNLVDLVIAAAIVVTVILLTFRTR